MSSRYIIEMTRASHQEQAENSCKSTGNKNLKKCKEVKPQFREEEATSANEYMKTVLNHEEAKKIRATISYSLGFQTASNNQKYGKGKVLVGM